MTRESKYEFDPFDTIDARIEDQQTRERLAEEQDAEALATERLECAQQDAADADYSDNPVLYASRIRSRARAMREEASERWFGMYDTREEVA